MRFSNKGSWDYLRNIWLSLRSPSVSKLLSVVSAASAAQLVTIAAYPLLTRLYEPADFALFGAFVAVVSILAAIVTFRADRMLLFADTEQERQGILMIWIILTIVVAIVLGFAITVWPAVTSSLSAPMMWLAFGAAIATAWLNILMADSARLLETAKVSVSQISRSVTLFASQVLAAVLGMKAYGLVTGWILAILTAITVLSFRASALTPRLSSGQTLAALRRDTRGMIFGGGQAGLNAFSNNLPVLVAALILPPQQAGLYVLADRLMRLPINLVSNTIRNYLAVMGRKESGNVNRRFVLKASIVLFALSLLCAALVALAGPQVFNHVFGEAWRPAGKISAILSVVVVANMTALPAQAIIMSTRRYGSILILEAMICLFRIGLLSFLGAQATATTIATVATVTSVAYYGSFIIFYALMNNNNNIYIIPRKN